MTRIAIIGNAGGGKSVLAQHLGQALELPLHSIDDAQWRPGWTRAPAEYVAEAHAGWLRSDRWIIDGWGDWELIIARFVAADAIVVVDFPLRVHLDWAMRRQDEVIRGLRRDWPPQGCSAAEITDALLRTMRYVDSALRPRLLQLAADERFVHRVIHLRSPNELEKWRTNVTRRGA